MKKRLILSAGLLSMLIFNLIVFSQENMYVKSENPEFIVEVGDVLVFESSYEYDSLNNHNEDFISVKYIKYNVSGISDNMITFQNGVSTRISQIETNLTSIFFYDEYFECVGYILIPLDMEIVEYLDEGKEELIDRILQSIFANTYPTVERSYSISSTSDYEFKINFDLAFIDGNLECYYLAKYDTQGIRYERELFIYFHGDYSINYTIKYLQEYSSIDLIKENDQGNIPSYPVLMITSIMFLSIIIISLGITKNRFREIPNKY
jgi:hypothetical protein